MLTNLLHLNYETKKNILEKKLFMVINP